MSSTITGRNTPINIPPQEFRVIGHQLIDTVADFLSAIEQLPVTTGESFKSISDLVGTGSLPDDLTKPGDVLAHAANLLVNHSLFNGHPKFMGYITSSPAPLGALADFLAAIVNPNVGANILSPVATEIEKQTIQWLAEFIGVSADHGGILVSGGNMANFTGFLAGRTAKAPSTTKSEGLTSIGRMMVYCSKATHTWIEKAAVLFGLGTKSIHWIATDAHNKIHNHLLEQAIQEDIDAGYKPIMVVATAGDVSTGAVDDLKGVAAVCKKYDLWFHVDGAYGIPAAIVPKMKRLFDGIEEADSIALDPHKWLYSPLEAGCTLVKNPNHLTDAYSSHPEYYNFGSSQEGASHNYYEYGLQNSRGFRALKVWMSLQHVGRKGYAKMIEEDIELSKQLFELAQQHKELEAVTQSLSITTLRYVPLDFINDRPEREKFLNALNEALLNRLQQGGKVFLSNAVVNGKYCLRSCIVNFRTSQKDIEEVVEIIVNEGRALHKISQDIPITNC